MRMEISRAAIANGVCSVIGTSSFDRSFLRLVQRQERHIEESDQDEPRGGRHHNEGED